MKLSRLTNRQLRNLLRMGEVRFSSPWKDEYEKAVKIVRLLDDVRRKAKSGKDSKGRDIPHFDYYRDTMAKIKSRVEPEDYRKIEKVLDRVQWFKPNYWQQLLTEIISHYQREAKYFKTQF